MADLPLARAEGIFLLAIILVGGSIGLSAAEHNPAYIDEITYARLGYSLSQGHLASDSSFLSIYSQYGLVRSDIVTPYGYIDSVEPWLDHPPLVGFLLVPFSLTGSNPRLLIVVLDLGIVLLLYAFLRDIDRLAGAAASCVFLLFMTLYPILTMLFLDSAVSFFLILTMVLLTHYSKSGSRRGLYLAGLVAGLAALSKVPGIAAIMLLALLFVSSVAAGKKGARALLPPFLIAVGVASIWPIYGFGVEPGLFWQLTGENIARSALSNTSFTQFLTSLESSATFTKPSYVQMVDPVLQASWISTLVLVVVKRYRVPSIAFASYLIVLVLIRYAPPQMTIPLFPFFAISLGATSSMLLYYVASKVKSRRAGASRFAYPRESIWTKPISQTQPILSLLTKGDGRTRMVYRAGTNPGLGLAQGYQGFAFSHWSRKRSPAHLRKDGSLP